MQGETLLQVKSFRRAGVYIRLLLGRTWDEKRLEMPFEYAGKTNCDICQEHEQSLILCGAAEVRLEWNKRRMACVDVMISNY